LGREPSPSSADGTRLITASTGTTSPGPRWRSSLTTSELLRRSEERVRSWVVPVETAAVFGSLARGEGSVDSDVDLLLVRADDMTGERALAWDDQVDSLVTAVQSWSDNLAQPYDISVSDLRAHVDADEPIVGSWRREAITLVGRDLSALLRSVAR
jgi:predicted nucleotidyltransferase